MSSRTRPSVRQGFVLLEAVIALTIIGLFAVALLSTTSTQLRTAAKANTLLVARSLAEDRIAALRLLDYDDLGDPPDSLLEGRFPDPFQEYTWVATVVEMEDEYDLFGAEVVVEGRGETLPLRTLIHEPSPVVQVSGQVTGVAGGVAGGRGAAPRTGGEGQTREAGRGGPPGGRGGEVGRGGRGGQTGRTGRGATTAGRAGSRGTGS